MPQKTFAAPLVVTIESQRVGISEKGVQHILHTSLVHHAGAQIFSDSLSERHDGVRVALVIACDDLASLHGKRHLYLVAVAEYHSVAAYVVHFYVSAESFVETRLDVGFFDLFLLVVTNMLHIATAATVKYRAQRINPVLTRLKNFYHGSAREFLVYLAHHNSDLFSLHAKRHEDDHAVHARNSLAFHARGYYLYVKNIALFHTLIVSHAAPCLQQLRIIALQSAHNTMGGSI